VPVYLLTNKDTHARAVVIARDEYEARRTRPDGKATYDPVSETWRTWDGALQMFRRPPALTSWPEDFDRIHADEIAGQVHRDFDGITSVLAFQDDGQLRVKGEGPDETWGVQTVLHLLDSSANPDS
jgi:hypothetical protein